MRRWNLSERRKEIRERAVEISAGTGRCQSFLEKRMQRNSGTLPPSGGGVAAAAGKKTGQL